MYVHRTNNGKRISQYTCSQYTKVPCGTLCKTQHRINEDVVLSLVSKMLKAIAEYAKHDRTEFVRVVQEAQSSQQTAEVKKQRTRLATAKLAPLKRLSPVELPSANGFDKPFAASKFEYENLTFSQSTNGGILLFPPSVRFMEMFFLV